jgi:hypothetical protein
MGIPAPPDTSIAALQAQIKTLCSVGLVQNIEFAQPGYHYTSGPGAGGTYTWSFFYC